MADAKLTALTAASALAAADLFYVSQSAASRKATGTQLLTLVGTTYVPLGGGTMTGALTIASGTLTASAPALNITQTWTTGAAFTGALMNITDTSSTAGSLLQDWQVGGTSKASIAKNGLVTAAFGIFGALAGTGSSINYFNAGIRSISAGEVAWTSGNVNGVMDLALYRDAAATLAQRNGTTQQIKRIYNTYTDASNYERLTLTGVAGTSVIIAAESAGTGGANLNITLTPKGTGNVNFQSGSYVDTNGTFYTAGTFVAGTTVWVGATLQLRMGNAIGALWSSTANANGTIDTGLQRGAAGQVDVTNGTAGTFRDVKLRNLLSTEYHQMTEMTAPSAPATNSVRIYAEDNGAGKTRLMALFATGSAVQLGIEP